MATTEDSLQDSRLPDSRFFADFVQAGVLVVGARNELRFASAGACELFGTADESALRARFRDVAPHLRLVDADGPGPHYGRADVPTDDGARAIRFETHTLRDGGAPSRVVFVRDRAHLLPSDRVLLLASQAQANRHVLTGLVHAAKGPLNNFGLTLALLETGLARARAAGPTPDLLARFERYAGVLRSESTRLANCVEQIHALTVPAVDEREAVDLCALARECAGVLRHGATMHEVALDVEVPGVAIVAEGERALLRLALSCAMITVIELTAPHGRVALRVYRADAEHAALAVRTTQPALPSALASSVFRLSCTAESAFSAAIAARLIVEAQGGRFTVLDDNHRPGFDLHVCVPPA